MRYIESVKALKTSLMEKFQQHSTCIIPTDVPYPFVQNDLQKAQNRIFYFEAIADAGAVIAYTEDHIGIATAMEIGIAVYLGKQLFFTHPPKANELQAMLTTGKARLLLPLHVSEDFFSHYP